MSRPLRTRSRLANGQHACMDDDWIDLLEHCERAARVVLGTTAAAALLGTLVARALAS